MKLAYLVDYGPSRLGTADSMQSTRLFSIREDQPIPRKSINQTSTPLCWGSETFHSEHGVK